MVRPLRFLPLAASTHSIPSAWLRPRRAFPMYLLSYLSLPVRSIILKPAAAFGHARRPEQVPARGAPRPPLVLLGEGAREA